MRINNNISALNAWRGLTNTDNALSKSLEKLSSGLRINRAGDDAAGLAISEKMRGQIRGLNQASRNAQDGISLIQTAEGALTETHAILQRMRELAVQASNDTNTNDDRLEIQKEMNQLTSELTRIGNNTDFNTKKLINGDMDGGGEGAVQNKAALDFTSAFAAAENGSVELVIGGETITVTLDGTKAAGTAPTIGANAVTIGSLTVNQLGLDLADALTIYVAQNQDSALAQFTFGTDTNMKTTITAKADGAFAGSGGVDSVRLTSGMMAESLAVVDVGEDGTNGKAQLQIGANANQQFTVSIGDMRASKLGVSSTVSGGSFATGANNELTDTTGVDAEYALDVTSATAATSALTLIDTAIADVSSERSKLGAYQNRLEHTIKNLGVASENLAAAESRIRDVDMAAEMMNFTKQNILMQAGTAMLAQANARPQSVLQLLG